MNDVGLCVLFPVQCMELPSLWGAIDGSTGPLPHHHDDEALAKTWRRKDTLPAQKLIYYGKLLRGKATLLALDLLPSFYALSPNFGGEADYLVEYKVGQLSREARDIYDVLLEEGALPTGELRRKAHLANRSQKYRYNRAIVELQRKLTVVKVDTTDAGPSITVMCMTFSFVAIRIRWKLPVFSSHKRHDRGSCRGIWTRQS